MSSNGGEVLVQTLLSRDVDTVFFVPGGTYVTVLEALSRQVNAIRSVPTRLESSAVFAAESYAALARKPACVFVSRAPGASNAAIGVHTAMQSSRPLVLFIANIPKPLKQREAFQEIDYALMYEPIAKAVFDVHSFDEVAPVTARALDLAVSGRPGPVVVSVSKDVLDGVTGDPPIPPRGAPVRIGPDAGAIADAAELIAKAERPVLLAGELVAFEGAHRSLRRLAERSGAGVLAAYRQQDVLANDHPAWLGQLTLNRTPHVERALAETDLVVALGTRLDSVTTADYAFPPPGLPLVLVYPEPAAFSQWQATVAIGSTTGPAMRALAEACAEPEPRRLAWRDALHAEERAYATPGDIAIEGDVDMGEVVRVFGETVPPETVVVSDAGTFGRWLHRYHLHTLPDTSLGPVSGAMGYGLPGGIGAATAVPGRPVVVWVGDGGFLMTGHEAATIVQERLPVKIIVCDNSAWGSILVHQNKRFPGWDFGTRLRSPDFAVLGQGYGMPSFTVSHTAEFGPALEAAMGSDGPALVHLRLDARDVSPYEGAGTA